VSGPYDDRARRGSTVTADDRDTARDVELARANMRHAEPRYGRPPARRTNSGDRLHSFVRRYGWRAYALPILALLTVAALMTSTSSNEPSAPAGKTGTPGAAAAPVSSPPTASSRIALGKDDNQGALSDKVLRAAVRPGAAYTKVGTGTYRVLPGTGRKFGSGKLFRYSIDVENGVQGVDLAQFAGLVDKTLDDPRSWSGHGVAVQRVDSGRIDFHVSLTSTMTVRNICGFDIPVETSCYAAAAQGGTTVNRVVFNVARWMRGAPAYLGDLDAYRIYMINHENGHALGHNHAHQCLPGGLAPVMMQQTFGLRSTTTGKLCGANPWPFPPGVAGTPGAEQVDTAQNNEYGRGD
jgi:hypothetical protein